MTEDMTKPYTGGPAYPTQAYDRDAAMNGFGVAVTDDPGMTLRDYFAAQFIQCLEPYQGMLMLHQKGQAFTDPGDIAKGLYELADAMLEARDQ